MPDRPATLPLQPARVLLHTAFVALPLAYALGLIPGGPMRGAALALTALFVGADAARRVWPAWNRWVFGAFAPLLRERERDRLTGASYSLLALAVAMWAFPPAVVGAAFLYHSVGDTAAGLVGRRWGRRRWSGKSVEGSAALFGAGSLTAWPFVGAVPAVAGAAAAAAVELALPVDDNLSVPLVGGATALAAAALAGS